MKKKLSLIILVTAFLAGIAIYSVERKECVLRAEISTVTYYSRIGAPPMPWPPAGVSFGVTSNRSCLLDDEHYVYPKATTAKGK